MRELKRKLKIGYRKSEKKTIKIISRNREYCSVWAINVEADWGKSEKSIFDPSSGGIGTKLNMPKARFTKTITEVMK